VIIALFLGALMGSNNARSRGARENVAEAEVEATTIPEAPLGGMEHTDAGQMDMNEHGHEEEVESFAIAEALAMGDPENGRVLFNTITMTGFACATCHFTDTTARLIGPGLLGVGSLQHDPTLHAASESESMDHRQHSMTGAAEATATPDTAEDPGIAVVEYLRTSILNPSAYVVPGYPDNLMPATFEEVFTEQEIADLIAYLLTLK
jgi:cytochrome c2